MCVCRSSPLEMQHGSHVPWWGMEVFWPTAAVEKKLIQPSLSLGMY